MSVTAHCIGCDRKCRVTAETEYLPSACLYGTAGARSRWFDVETIRELKKIEVESI